MAPNPAPIKGIKAPRIHGPSDPTFIANGSQIIIIAPRINILCPIYSNLSISAFLITEITMM